MKIGILASGNDMLTLFNFLASHDHEYVVFYDQLFGFWGDKDGISVLERVKFGIEQLRKQNVDHIIVPPMIELQIKDPLVLPIFSTYLKEYCFAYSLVGKIGFFGDYLDVSLAQPLLEKLLDEYKLSDLQKAISKFKFALRGKDISSWKNYLNEFSYSEPMVNKLVKFDLRYFKDANVDTIIPLTYGVFHFEKTIGKFFNFKKTRFHKLAKIESIFKNLVKNGKKYSVKILFTGQVETLQKQKRIMWLLQRGKNVVIDFERACFE